MHPAAGPPRCCRWSRASPALAPSTASCLCFPLRLKAAALWLVCRATQAAGGGAHQTYTALTGLLLSSACAGVTVAMHDLVARFPGGKDTAAPVLLGLSAAQYAAVAVRLQARAGGSWGQLEAQHGASGLRGTRASAGLQPLPQPPPLPDAPLGHAFPPPALLNLQAPLLGTLAVWWLLASLGFFIAVLPFTTVIGFQSGLGPPSAAATALLTLFLPSQAAPGAAPLPPALAPFRPGVWLWCPLVLNLAALIRADRRWAREGCWQLPPASALAAASWRLRLRLLARWAGQARAPRRGRLGSLGCIASLRNSRRLPLCHACSVQSNPPVPSALLPASHPPAVRAGASAQRGRDWRHLGVWRGAGSGALPSRGGHLCVFVVCRPAGGARLAPVSSRVDAAAGTTLAACLLCDGQLACLLCAASWLEAQNPDAPSPPLLPSCHLLRSLGLAWAALAFGALLWGAAWAAHTWPWLLGLGGGG